MGHPRKDGVVYSGDWRWHYNKHWTTDEENLLADDLIRWLKEPWGGADGKGDKKGIPKNIYVHEFFQERLINKATVDRIVKRNEYFAWAYNLAKEEEEKRFFLCGTRKGQNPVMFLVGLKAKYKWDDGTLYTSQDQKRLVIEDEVKVLPEKNLEVTKDGVIEVIED